MNYYKLEVHGKQNKTLKIKAKCIREVLDTLDVLATQTDLLSDEMSVEVISSVDIFDDGCDGDCNSCGCKEVDYEELEKEFYFDKNAGDLEMEFARVLKLLVSFYLTASVEGSDKE